MVLYPYSFQAAFDPNMGTTAPRDSVGQVFAVGDISFEQPLPTFDLNGFPVTLTVGEFGYLPDFQVEDHTAVVWKSGDYVFQFATTVPVPGPRGIAVAGAEVSGDALTFSLEDGTALPPVILPTGPGGSDAGVAGYVASGGSATDAELGRKFIRRGELVVDVRDYGAKADGVTDDTDAINAAATAAAALGDAGLLFMQGTYRTTGTITVPGALEASRATIKYEGTGTALILGSNTPGLVTPRRTLIAPRVVRDGATGYDGSSIGVMLYNLNSCDVQVPFVQHFEEGLVLAGAGQGVVHNNMRLGSLWGNRRNFVLRSLPGGWVNSNTIIGGRLSPAAWAIADDTNGHHILIEPGASGLGAPNGNNFIGTSLEGQNAGYYRVVVDGRYNHFINCRWEHPAEATLRVLYKSTASNNRIQGGYDGHKIVEVFETGSAANNHVPDATQLFIIATGVTALPLPNATKTTVNTWVGVNGYSYTYDPVGGTFSPRQGRWNIEGQVMFDSPSATGTRKVTVYKNTSVVESVVVPGAQGFQTVKFNASEYFNGSDTFRVEVEQNSGAAGSLSTSSRSCRLSVSPVR